MANFIITESQLSKIVSLVNEDKRMSKLEAMRKIASVLKKNGYNEEDIVDFIIKLRQKDEFTHFRAKNIKDEPDYEESINTMVY
jgi:tRNA G26 N,N-dimethylase Trm1